MTTSGKKTGLLSVGILVLLAGLVAGAGLLYSAGQREADAVRDLARAPVGCDTTLDFDGDGEFFIYIETVGTLDDGIAGDCAQTGDFEWSGDDAPIVTLTLTSPSGNDVALDSRGGINYSSDGFEGRSVRTFQIDEVGDHVLRVESPDDSVGFAAAVGRDPSNGVAAMRSGGLAACIAGLLVGMGLIVLSRRRSDVALEPTSETWAPTPAAWPTSPPGMPVAPPPAPGTPVTGPPNGFPTPSATGVGGPPPPPASWAPPPPSGPAAGVAPGPAAPTDSAWTNPADLPVAPPSSAPTDGSTGDGQRSPWAPPES